MEFKTIEGVVHLGDCRDQLDLLEDNSIDLVLTDPPYFIDGMGDDWDNDRLHAKVSKAGIIGGRPIGMKFDRQQSYEFQRFMDTVSDKLMRVMKPGAFLVCFSQARLYHRAATSLEDAGFEIRDMFAWHHNGQAKAFTQKHFVRKNRDLDEESKQRILEEIGDRKTPQLKPQLEPMVFAQKPREGTFIENWMSWKTGLIDTDQTLDGSFPGNLMVVGKPTRDEKGSFNNHLTVKPVRLLGHLIRMLTLEGQVVLDPFLGSGSTAVAAVRENRRYVGIEKDTANYDIAVARLERADHAPMLL
jgi:site-specific DNA-methyltransferase (adenine-specific)